MFKKDIQHQQPEWISAAFPFQQTENCRTKLHTRDPRTLLAFASQEIPSSNRRKEYYAHRGNGHNLPSAEEATVRSVKHPFPAGKMPVREQFRVTCMAIASEPALRCQRAYSFSSGGWLEPHTI